MASYPNKMEVAVASHPSHHFPMETFHVTTTNFFRPSVVLGRYFPRTFHGKIDVNTFTRCVPMPAPVMSTSKDNNRFFFVPCRTIWPSWYEFMTDAPDISSSGVTVPATVPVLLSNTISEYFASDPTLSTEVSSSPFDFSFRPASTNKLYQLTNLGSYQFSILKALGYDFSYTSSSGSLKYSALPLLAFAKVMCDWYFPSNYAKRTTNFITFEQLFHTHGIYTLQVTDLQEFFSLVSYVQYDSDRFVDAWDNPVSPNTGLFSYNAFPDITMLTAGGFVPTLNSIVTNNSTGTPEVTTPVVSSRMTQLTQYDISMLKALTQFTRSHQLVGGRAVDRWLADYGLSLSPAKVNRSQYLGTNTAPIQYGDVMSHADTSTAALGDYAGKGSAFINSKSIDFDFGEDDGFLLVINTTLPNVGYCDGYDRQVRALTKFDYYQPRFDGIGTEVIEVGEVCCYASDNDTSSVTRKPTSIFGFSPRYSWIKSLKSNMTGNFMATAFNVGLDAWQLFRRFPYRYSATGYSAPVHGLNFVIGSLDGAQYDRIFNLTLPKDGDPFIKIHHISIDAYMNALPMYDDYLLTHGNKKKISVNTSGNNVN